LNFEFINFELTKKRHPKTLNFEFINFELTKKAASQKFEF